MFLSHFDWLFNYSLFIFLLLQVPHIVLVQTYGNGELSFKVHQDLPEVFLLDNCQIYSLFYIVFSDQDKLLLQTIKSVKQNMLLFQQWAVDFRWWHHQWRKDVYKVLCVVASIRDIHSLYLVEMVSKQKRNACLVVIIQRKMCRPWRLQTCQSNITDVFRVYFVMLWVHLAY